MINVYNSLQQFEYLLIYVSISEVLTMNGSTVDQIKNDPQLLKPTKKEANLGISLLMILLTPYKL